MSEKMYVRRVKNALPRFGWRFLRITDRLQPGIPDVIFFGGVRYGWLEIKWGPRARITKEQRLFLTSWPNTWLLWGLDSKVNTIWRGHEVGTGASVDMKKLEGGALVDLAYLPDILKT